MKKHILHIILLILIGLYGCKKSQSDYNTGITEKEIYTFMKFALSDLKVSDTVDIQKKPQFLFYEEPGRNGFKILDFTILETENDQYYSTRIFKPSDTTFTKNQNDRILNGFKWNKRKLGFEENDTNPMKIHLSIPYFSADKKTVVIFKRYDNTSAFMAGGWTIMKYLKTENGWKSKSIRSGMN